MFKKLAADALKMLFLHPVTLVWNSIKAIMVFLLLSTIVESLCHITLPYMQSLRQYFIWYSPELTELTLSSSDTTKDPEAPSALSLTKSFTLPGSRANEFKSPINLELYQLSNLVATHPEIYQDPLMRDLFKIQAAQLYFNSQYSPQNAANANLALSHSLPEVYDLPKLHHSLPEAPLTRQDSYAKYLEQANVLNSATNNLQTLSVLDHLVNGEPLTKNTTQNNNTALSPKLNEVAAMLSKQKRASDSAQVNLKHPQQGQYLAARPVEEEEEEEELTSPNKSEDHIISLQELEHLSSLENLRSLEGTALCDFDKKPWSYLDLELEDPLENLSATDLAKFDQVQEALDLLYEHFGALDSHDLELVFALYAPEKVLLALERNEIRTQLLAQSHNCPTPNTDPTKLAESQLKLNSQQPSLATKTVSTKQPKHAPCLDTNDSNELKNSLETKVTASANQSSETNSTLAAPTSSLEHLRANTNSSSAHAQVAEQTQTSSELTKHHINTVLPSQDLLSAAAMLDSKDPSTTSALAQMSQVLPAAQQLMQGLSDLSALANINNHISEHDVRELTTDRSALKDSSLTTSSSSTPNLPIAPAPNKEKLELIALNTASKQQLALNSASASTFNSAREPAPNLFITPNTKTSPLPSLTPPNVPSAKLIFHALPQSSDAPLNTKILIATLPNYEDSSLLRQLSIEEEEEEEEIANATPNTSLIAANNTDSKDLDKSSTNTNSTSNSSLVPAEILASMTNLASYHAPTSQLSSSLQPDSKKTSKKAIPMSNPEILERKSANTNCSLSSPDLANTQYLSSNNAREPQLPTLDPSSVNLSNNKELNNSTHTQLDAVSADPVQVAQDLYEYFIALQDHQLMNKPLEQIRQNALYLTALINAPEDLLPHCPGQELNISDLKDQAYRQALIYQRFLEQALNKRAQRFSQHNLKLNTPNQLNNQLPQKPLLLSSSPTTPNTPVAAQSFTTANAVNSTNDLALNSSLDSKTAIPNTPVAAQSFTTANAVNSNNDLAPIWAMNSKTTTPNAPVAAQSVTVAPALNSNNELAPTWAMKSKTAIPNTPIAAQSVTVAPALNSNNELAPTWTMNSKIATPNTPVAAQSFTTSTAVNSTNELAPNSYLDSKTAMPNTPVAAQSVTTAPAVNSTNDLAPTWTMKSKTATPNTPVAAQSVTTATVVNSNNDLAPIWAIKSKTAMPNTPVAAQSVTTAPAINSTNELAPTWTMKSKTAMPNTPIAAQLSLARDDTAAQEPNRVSAPPDIGFMSEVGNSNSTTVVSLPTNLEGLRLGEQRPLSLGNLNLSAPVSLSDQELLGRPFFKSEDLDLALRQALHLPQEQATTSLLRSLGISDNASQGSHFSPTNESTIDNYQEQLKALAQGLTYNEQALKQDQERALHMLKTNIALLQERQIIPSNLLSQLQDSLVTLDLVPLAIITEIVAHARHLGDYSPEQQEQLTILANFVLSSQSHQRHNYLSLAMLKHYQQICLSYGFKAVYHQAPLLFYQAASLQAA